MARDGELFANPEVDEYLEGEEVKYAIRFSTNRVLRDRVGHSLRRPVGSVPVRGDLADR